MTTNTPNAGAENPSAPLTSNSELLQIAFARLGELQTQIDRLGAVNDLHAAALDEQAAVITRLSQRLSVFEDEKGVVPSIQMPQPRILGESLISHNRNPKPKKKKLVPVRIVAKYQVIGAANGKSKLVGKATSMIKGKK
jgi:hypothetical protein